MIETLSESGSQPLPNDETVEHADLRGIAIASYVLFLVACMNGLTALIGVVMAYAKRRDATGTIWRSHFDNIIVVFWVIAIGILIGILTWPIALGALIAQFLVWPAWPPIGVLPFVFSIVVFPALAIWYFFRVIRGFIRALGDRPY